jgi:EAL domain-containing protein (putative c-di-GMP-specific phosphodiesterase class I)
MYFAKEAGVVDLIRYDEAIRDSADSLREMEIELNDAVDRRDEFSVVYQPIVAAHSRDLVRAEALARWKSPSIGDVPPSVFIGVAERSGLITKLGWVILDKIICDLLTYPNLQVSINISPLQLLQHNFAADLLNRVRRSGVSTLRIELEVTEGVAIQNPERVALCLSELIAGGFSIALDDFGTGFSSLNYVHQMPFSCLKVDRSFVSGSLEKAANARLINSIVHMGHALEKIIVAEGVETPAQAWELEKSGCDLLQGFLFGRPESVLALVEKFPLLSRGLVA